MQLHCRDNRRKSAISKLSVRILEHLQNHDTCDKRQYQHKSERIGPDELQLEKLLRGGRTRCCYPNLYLRM